MEGLAANGKDDVQRMLEGISVVNELYETNVGETMGVIASNMNGLNGISK